MDDVPHESDIPQVRQRETIEKGIMSPTPHKSHKGIGLGLGIELSDLWDVSLNCGMSDLVTWNQILCTSSFFKGLKQLYQINPITAHRNSVKKTWPKISKFSSNPTSFESSSFK